MKLTRRASVRPEALLLAPVLTVSLVLMLFIFLSSSFLTQPGVGVKSPSSPFLLAPQRNPVVVAITGAPKPSLYFQNAEITTEELARRLEVLPRPSTVIIKADRHAAVEHVVQAANAALSLELDVVLATEPLQRLRPRARKALPLTTAEDEPSTDN